MQKFLIFIVLSLISFSCAEAPSMKNVAIPETPDIPVDIPEEPLAPFNEQKLGDIGTISLIDNGGGSYTYDYTGLGINDEYEIDLIANYFVDNITSTVSSNTSVFVKAKKFLWAVNRVNYRLVDSSYYKQTFDVPNFNDSTKRVSITIKHISYVNSFLSENYYFYKGLNNGSGEMELVGRIINNSEGSTAEGDTYPLEPYNP